MAQTKAGLTKLTVGGQVQLARTMVTKMTGNSNFTTPSPTLTALTTAADALEAANNAAVAARSTAKLATTTQEDKQAILLGLLNLEISYVQNITGGDKTKIESAGLSVRNTPAPVGPLPAPVSIEVNTNTDPGMMK